MGSLEEPTSGAIAVEGGPPQEAQRRKQIGFVFQDPGLLPWRTVQQNVLLPLQVNRRQDEAGRPRAQSLLSTVGLDEFAAYYPHQLSGGMRQRAALARALVFDPSLLLMDEPLGSLDELTRSAMRYELLRIWEASRKTVVMVTHSIAEAVLLSDRVAVMAPRPGRITEIVAIDLPRPRKEGIEREARFLDYVERVHRSLTTGGYSGPAAVRAPGLR
jgi:NitT/TauT family transport system ATP-binding protein